jgi:small subunit ribosomal protein S9
MPKKLKEKKEEPVKEKAVVPVKYIYAVGRRKESSCQVRLYPGVGKITVNQKDFRQYFPAFYLQKKVLEPLKMTKFFNKLDILIRVMGGGTRGQAEAIRLGIARALTKSDIQVRIPLKAAGFLTRDARVKERKKPGLKRARRAPQWAKR